MTETSSSSTFSSDDFASLAGLAIKTWRLGTDGDWSAKAGTLDWTCRETAAHAIDTVFAPAMFLASRRQHAYPPFEPLRVEDGASIPDLVDGLIAASNTLVGVIVMTPPGTPAIIRRSPAVETAEAPEFAARGGLELILHTHDIATGLGLAFVPDLAMCGRLRDQTGDWPSPVTRQRPATPWPDTADPWSDLLQRSGRPRVS